MRFTVYRAAGNFAREEHRAAFDQTAQPTLQLEVADGDVGAGLVQFHRGAVMAPPHLSLEWVGISFENRRQRNKYR